MHFLRKASGVFGVVSLVTAALAHVWMQVEVGVFIWAFHAPVRVCVEVGRVRRTISRIRIWHFLLVVLVLVLWNWVGINEIGSLWVCHEVNSHAFLGLHIEIEVNFTAQHGQAFLKIHIIILLFSTLWIFDAALALKREVLCVWAGGSYQTFLLPEVEILPFRTMKHLFAFFIFCIKVFSWAAGVDDFTFFLR